MDQAYRGRDDYRPRFDFAVAGSGEGTRKSFQGRPNLRSLPAFEVRVADGGGESYLLQQEDKIRMITAV